MASKNGNVHTHLAVFAEIGNILVYVYKYAKNNQRRKVAMDIAQRQIRLIDAAKVCPYGKKSWKALTEAGPR
ncbi:MAG: hypothetical protein PHI77_01260 [Candidatus Pacebacteria bacterium]|nr:hypothetical protein [Candidatus Paceibacterota bacterium]